jgi:hypothetical protein
MEALRGATSTSYFKKDGTLWVKLVSTGASPRPGRGGGTPDSIQVNR